MNAKILSFEWKRPARTLGPIDHAAAGCRKKFATHRGMKRMQITVECYAGYRGEETPRRIRLGDQDLEVTEILDRWLAPDHRYFKLKTGDNGIWIVRHDTIQETWELTAFRQG